MSALGGEEEDLGWTIRIGPRSPPYELLPEKTDTEFQSESLMPRSSLI